MFSTVVGAASRTAISSHGHCASFASRCLLFRLTPRVDEVSPTRRFLSQHQHRAQHHAQHQQTSLPSAPFTTSHSRFVYVLVSLPVLVWCRDCLFDVVRVEGTSMEPALKSGDWVLVRKADAGALLHFLTPQITLFGGSDEKEAEEPPPIKSLHDEEFRVKDCGNPHGDEEKDESEDTSAGDHKDAENVKRKNTVKAKAKTSQKQPTQAFLTRTQEALLRSKLKNYEEELTHAEGSQHSQRLAWWYTSRPPMVLPGQVVLLHSPEHFGERHIKRVIAVGGQWLLSSPHDKTKKKKNSLHQQHPLKRSRVGLHHHYYQQVLEHSQPQLLPPHVVHVEGDNANNSRDSRQYGLLSKNSLVGVAECIVWPPRRWQRVRLAQTPTVLHGPRPRPRVFWR